MPTEPVIKILIAEDHPKVRAAMRHLLESQPDMEVVGEAGDGLEALKLVVQLDPAVVLMDISMPRMNGIEATRRISAIRPDVAVLVITAHDVTQYEPRVIEAGAVGILPKGISGCQLLEHVRAVGRAAIRASSLRRSRLGDTSDGPRTSRLARPTKKPRECWMTRTECR